MTFAALRQTVLRAHALSTDRFAETVELTTAAETLQVRAKITHRQLGPRGGARSAMPGEDRRGTYDEREQIEVLVSRDASWEFALPTRPQPTDGLRRAVAIDPDQRPFTFRGEVIHEGDQHAVYVFERPRRIGQGKTA
jgi:hypothetical protein